MHLPRKSPLSTQSSGCVRTFRIKMDWPKKCGNKGDENAVRNVQDNGKPPGGMWVLLHSLYPTRLFCHRASSRPPSEDLCQALVRTTAPVKRPLWTEPLFGPGSRHFEPLQVASGAVFSFSHPGIEYLGSRPQCDNFNTTEHDRNARDAFWYAIQEAIENDIIVNETIASVSPFMNVALAQNTPDRRSFNTQETNCAIWCLVATVS